MTPRKRVGAAIAIAALVASAGFASTASAATSTSTISAGLTQVNLLNFNDFHGRIDKGAGLPFACLIQNERAALGSDSTLLLSAGDNVGASLFVSSIQDDQPTIDYLNALDLAATAVGNHEFDRGFADLRDRIAPASDYPNLGANVYNRGTTTPALPEYTVREVNGIKVGVIGVVTRETPSLVSPDGIQGIDFGDPVAAINRVAAQLTDGDAANGEADVIVAEVHDGAQQGTDNTADPTPIFNALVSDVSPSVDVIFNGHTHALYTEDAATTGGTRNISQAGSYGGGLTRVELGIDPTTKQVVEYANTYVPAAAPAGACLTDPLYLEAKAIVDAAVAEASVLGAVPVGKVTADITTAFKDATPANGVYTSAGVIANPRDDRLRESTLGNLVAQAWLDEMNVPGRAGADIGITNPGGMRAELFYAESNGEGDGVVTFEEAASVNPFANTLVVKDVTGAQFKTVLEQQWQPADASRAFLALGLSDNVRWTFDPNRAAGDRVTGVWVNDAPIDPAAVYTVASTSYLMAGGDNFTILREGTNTRDSGLIDTDAFVNFLGKNDPASPDFAKRGVGVIDAPTEAIEAETTIRIEGVDLTSLGSPVNTEFTVHVNDVQVGTAAIETVRVATPLPVRDGVSDVLVTLPAGTEGAGIITLVAKESGTTVTIPFTAAKTKTNGKPPHAGVPGKPPHAGVPGKPPHAANPTKPPHAGVPGKPPHAAKVL